MSFMSDMVAMKLFHVQETQGREVQTGKPPDRLKRKGLDWRSVYATILEQRQIRGTAPPVQHPYLIYMLGRPVTVMRKISGHSP